MPRTQLRNAEPRLQDVPLPGMVQCVTLQVNATFYRSGKTMRWVVILRDPEGNTELDRLTGALRPDDENAREGLLEDLAAAVASAEYQLHGTQTELKQALAEGEGKVARAPRNRKPVTPK